MKLEASHSGEEKKRWQVVRTDFAGPHGGSVEGEIVTADEDSGECIMNVGGETKTLSFGPRGIRIVSRAR